MALVENKFVEMAKQGKSVDQLGDEDGKLFVRAVMSEMTNKDKLPNAEDIPEKERSFCMGVVLKRIGVLELPISFTLGGILAAEALAKGVVGKMVTILIDCLTEYEGKRVNCKMLSDLYPCGFYNDETFEDYVDNYLKKRKVKWSNIY